MANAIVSRTLSVHKEHEVLLKLEAAGLDDDLAQAIIDSKDNELGRNMIQFARNGGKLVTIPQGTVVETKPQTIVPPAPQPWGSVELVSETENSVIFRGTIRRGRTPQQIVADLGRIPSTNSGVVATMPLIAGNGQDEPFVYEMFKPGRQTSDANVEVERRQRGLTRDLEVQALINALLPEFAGQHPNGDSWQDGNKKWCFANFFVRGGVGRHVGVDRGVSVWSDVLWFGGRK